MHSPASIAPDDIEQDTLALLLDDPGWVEAEFAAIMAAAGLADQTTVAFRDPGSVAPLAPSIGPPRRSRTRRPESVAARATVRAPPDSL